MKTLPLPAISGTSRRAVLMTAAAAAVFSGHGAQAQSPVSTHVELKAAAKNCVDVGDVCLKHCIRLTTAGDKSLLDCLRTTRAMLVVTTAMAGFAEQDAKHLKALAKVCLDVCTDCEAECRKHESHHVECKNCVQACVAMIVQVKKLLAA